MFVEYIIYCRLLKRALYFIILSVKYTPIFYMKILHLMHRASYYQQILLIQINHFIFIQFILIKLIVYTPMYILRTHSMSCIIIPCVCFLLLGYYVVCFFSLFSMHILTSCCIILLMLCVIQGDISYRHSFVF